jgi:hypothetical protein
MVAAPNLANGLRQLARIFVQRLLVGRISLQVAHLARSSTR